MHTIILGVVLLDIRAPSIVQRIRKEKSISLSCFLAMWEWLKGVLSSLRAPKQSYSIQAQDDNGGAPAGSTTDRRSAGDDRFKAWKAQWAGTIVVLVGVFSIWLNFSVLSVALPTLAKYFDTPEQNVAWVRLIICTRSLLIFLDR